MSDKEEKPQRWYNPKDTLKEPIYRTGLMVDNSLCNEKVYQKWRQNYKMVHVWSNSL